MDAGERPIGRFHISDELADGGAHAGPHIVILSVSGEIDYAACPHLRKRIFGHLDAGRRHLLLDLAMVSFIDSMAIGVLIAAAIRCKQAGDGALVAVCGTENERVLRVFDIAGVADAVPLHRSRKDALSALAATRLVEMPPPVAPDARGSAHHAHRRPARGRPTGLGAVLSYRAPAAAATLGTRSEPMIRQRPNATIDELA